MGLTFEVQSNNFPRIAQSLPSEADALVRTATFNILATSQGLVAVDTGFLKATGAASFEGDAGIISYSANYAAYVEFGTSRMRAQPYLTPAVEMERPAFMLGMQRLFD